jgi:hypothetical protein
VFLPRGRLNSKFSSDDVNINTKKINLQHSGPKGPKSGRASLKTRKGRTSLKTRKGLVQGKSRNTFNLTFLPHSVPKGPKSGRASLKTRKGRASLKTRKGRTSFKTRKGLVQGKLTAREVSS